MYSNEETAVLLLKQHKATIEPRGLSVRVPEVCPSLSFPPGFLLEYRLGGWNLISYLPSKGTSYILRRGKTMSCNGRNLVSGD